MEKDFNVFTKVIFIISTELVVLTRYLFQLESQFQFSWLFASNKSIIRKKNQETLNT